jgi:hypothetical protein
VSVPDEREDRAVMALIVGTLHPFKANFEVSQEEALEFLAKNIQLSPEDEAALKQRGSLKLPACGEEVGWTDRVADATADYVMHREESEQGLDEKTRAELASKRQEILDRLRKLRGEANEGP